MPGRPLHAVCLSRLSAVGIAPAACLSVAACGGVRLPSTFFVETQRAAGRVARRVAACRLSVDAAFGIDARGLPVHRRARPRPRRERCIGSI